MHSNGDAGELLSLELVDKNSVEKESRRGGYPDIYMCGLVRYILHSNIYPPLLIFLSLLKVAPPNDR